MLKHQERYEERAKASVCGHWGLAVVAGLIGASVGEAADVIKIESFEMKSPAETYTDPMDPSIDHVLVNQPGQALVAHEGGRLGTENTKRSGLDGRRCVRGRQSGPSTWADGQQGYRLNDTDA